MDTHKDVCIVLKKSLKWVPIIGWVRTYRRIVISHTFNLTKCKGHAILSLYLLGSFLGLRSSLSHEATCSLGRKGTVPRYPAHFHSLPRGYSRQSRYTSRQQEVC